MQMKLQLALFAASVSTAAAANTITQNLSWTINRSGATQKVRVVAYGDSIFAGYYGSISSVAKRAAPNVEGEYAQQAWKANVEIYRRAKSGAVASDIYKNKIVAEKSYMQAANTRVVLVEMCGNDFLQARSNFRKQTGTCDYAPLDTALRNCTYYQWHAMKFINDNASANTKVKMIVNLYYPGYDADNGLSGCNDPGSGQPINKQQKFLPYVAQSNWRACDFAKQYGFVCVDGFAQYMGADYASSGTGPTDSELLAWYDGESEADYVTRISDTLRSKVHDSNTHFVNASTSFDYLQSDDTHPTYTGSTVYVGFFGGTGSGSGPPDYADAQIASGKNPVWNQLGHERLGWAASLFSPAAP